MKSNAPVSLVTTTATNESSPELPNSEPEPPPRRDRRMPAPPQEQRRTERRMLTDACQLPRQSSILTRCLAFLRAAIQARSVGPSPVAISSYPDRVRPVRSGLRPLVEKLLDDVAVEGVALFHAHVQELQRILEAVQAPRQLFLSGAARPLVRRRERSGQGVDRRAGPLQPALDFFESCFRRRQSARSASRFEPARPRPR